MLKSVVMTLVSRYMASLIGIRILKTNSKEMPYYARIVETPLESEDT